eukprot:Gregarina_sp_Poly_1__4595@NODE_2461_length_2103_cov_9_578585_g1557_i0_p5_GENE_NODE_2461_length_2103_cov_9_578585_g1557_i0NODE_2461_length_2103_cov_9_578585_g1557_i0_p5_ORF_typecomplete_len121_score22_56_NODE_2461_length_2103_cov_9_578585_g1557_i0604966
MQLLATLQPVVARSQLGLPVILHLVVPILHLVVSIVAQSLMQLLATLQPVAVFSSNAKASSPSHPLFFSILHLFALAVSPASPASPLPSSIFHLFALAASPAPLFHHLLFSTRHPCSTVP